MGILGMVLLVFLGGMLVDSISVNPWWHKR